MNFDAMLAKQYAGQDPIGWLMQEKLDGVRALWTGKELISRNHKPFYYPEWFVAKLPTGIPLDGELWVGRGRFQTTASYVKKKYFSELEWSEVKYMVYDTPQDLPYLSRYHFLLYLNLPLWVNVLDCKRCDSESALLRFYEAQLDQGAEGIMLRHPTAGYEEKRSSMLLKVKPVLDDEAYVKGYTEGTGKYQGLVGALVCDWNGREILVGSGLTDAQRANPPQPGTLITFKYLGLTESGDVRHASFIGVRDE